MLGRLGRAGARWRYAILGVWAVVSLAGAVFGGGVYDRTESVEGARGESASAQERLDELAPEGEAVVAVISGRDFFTPALVESATKVMYELRELPGVAEVRDAYTAGGLIADDKQSSLAVIELDPEARRGRGARRRGSGRRQAAHDRRARGARRRQAAGRADVRRAGHRGRRARGSDRARRPRRRAGAVRRRAGRRRAPAARRAGDDHGLAAGAQRARERHRGQRVRRQRRHAARARARRRLQPADPRALPRGARRGSDKRRCRICWSGRPPAPAARCSSPGWRSRSRSRRSTSSPTRCSPRWRWAARSRSARRRSPASRSCPR